MLQFLGDLVEVQGVIDFAVGAPQLGVDVLSGQSLEPQIFGKQDVRARANCPYIRCPCGRHHFSAQLEPDKLLGPISSVRVYLYAPQSPIREQVSDVQHP